MISDLYVWLRRIEREDIPTLWNWSLNDELAFFNAFTSHKARAHFEQDYEANVHNQSLMDYLIIAGAEKKPVGFCGLKDINWVDRHAELFIAVCDDKARKQGMATIAILLLVKIAFFERNLNKLVFKVSEHNVRIMNLIEKWGFSHEGTLRQMHYFNSRYYDLHVYGVLRSEIEQFFDSIIDNLTQYMFPNAGEPVIQQIKNTIFNITGMHGSPREGALVFAS